MVASFDCLPPDVVNNIVALGVDSGWTKKDVGSFTIQSKTTRDVVYVQLDGLYLTKSKDFFHHIGLYKNSYATARALALEALEASQDLHDETTERYRIYIIFRRNVGNTIYCISDPVKASTPLRFTRLNKDYFEMQTRELKPTDIAVPAELEVGVIRGNEAWRTISKRRVPSLRRVATNGGAYLNFHECGRILTYQTMIRTWRGIAEIRCPNSSANEIALAQLFN